MEQKLINKILWWIPNKKVRDFIRHYIEKVDNTYDELNQYKNIINNTYNELNKYKNIIETFIPVKSLRFIEIMISKHCNMACYSCNHFSQLADEEFYDLDILEKDLKRLSELTNGLVEEFRITGGEPLLNPKCAEYFILIKKYFPNSTIDLNTNGILLLKQNDLFWETVQKYARVITISGYPLNLDIKALRDKCNSYNIPLSIYIEEGHEKKVSYKTLLDINSKLEPEDNFYKCGPKNGNCIHLFNGKLYPCCVSANVRFFNKFFNQNYPITSLDYLDIHQKKVRGPDIAYFLSRPIPFCKYCIQPNKIIGEWKPSKKDINEYI